MSCRALAIILLLSLSCASFRAPSLPSNCPVEPLANEDRPEHLSLRARVRMEAASREINFQAVAQITAESFVLVGITPYGTRLFKLTQNDGKFSADPALPVEYQTLSLYTADALIRTFLIHPPGGAKSWTRAGEQITDTLQAGKERRVYRPAQREPGSPNVTIDYDDGSTLEGMQGATIENSWCDYRAKIVLLAVDEKGPDS